MVVVRLTPPFPFVVVGSPDYLRGESGRSASTICVITPACACAARTGRSRPGLSSTATRRSRQSSPGRSIAHDYPTLLGAAIQGMGLAQVPGPLAKAPIADGRLQALLTPFAVTTPGVFLYYPEQTPGLAEAARVHRARQIPERRCAARRNRRADIGQARHLELLIQTLRSALRVQGRSRPRPTRDKHIQNVIKACAHHHDSWPILAPTLNGVATRWNRWCPTLNLR